MFTVPADKVDLDTHFNNEARQALSLVIHSSHVTEADPAKRVTFFKSGDTQFGGVRMAVHKRSFKCFDALLDDLSQRVPLPFGVRTVTTPRGTRSINCLEQLEDGGCYLCSDRRHVKPICMETFRRRSNVWHPGNPHVIHRKPTRPEDAPTARSSKQYHWHPKTIVLVKNNDPAVRRSIVLSRRTTRNLKVFIDEISQLMQCHIRKLYTLEGHKIDSIHSLMQCPSVLVCVGREPFYPLLVENLRKSSDEKLPGLTSRSRSSICSENHESTKNVNFGLETKKSIIHPRSDSSNRSTRFSLSSEKSCPNGPHMAHDHKAHVGTCSHAHVTLMNDDIEKRVLVNKDGSLSVEMKVRFRLLNDETLHWSTEIKKSVGTVNDSAFGNKESHYLQQGNSESCSDPESNVQGEHEELYVSKCNQRYLDESRECRNDCRHCKEYDIWKNPLHGDQRSIRHFRSSSSNASSHKIVCKKESVESMATISQSSEEYAEHVAQKETCFQQTVKAGDTKVEYRAVSHCCSCSEVCAKSDSRGSMDEKCKSPENDETSSNSLASVSIRSSQKENVRVAQISEDRPVSGTSSTSKILEKLKGYQDDEDTDDDELPPSISRASLWPHGDDPDDRGIMGSIASNCSITAHKSVYSVNHLPPKPPNKASFCCTQSGKSRHYSTSVSPMIELLVNQAENENNEGVRSAISAVSKLSSKPRKSHNSDIVSVVPGSVKVAIAESDSRKASTRSKCSNASRLSKKSYNMNYNMTDIPESLFTGQGPDGQDGHERAISISQRSRKSNACPHCGGSDRSGLKASANLFDMNVEYHSSRSVSSASDRTNTSEMSMKSENYKNITPVLNVSKNETNSQLRKDEQGIRERQETSVSAKTSDSEKMNSSNKAEIVHGAEQEEIVETEGIASHAASAKISTISAQFRTSKISNCNASVKSSQQSSTSECPVQGDEGREDEDTEKCAVSDMSVKPNGSSESRQSDEFQHNDSQTAESVATDNLCNQEAETEQEERMDMASSALSASVNASNSLGKSHHIRNPNTSDSIATDRALKRVERAEKVSRETSYRRMKLERSEISASHHSTAALNDSEERAASTVSAGTKVSWKSNPSDTNPCGACDGGSHPATPLPKISGNCENDSELESEMRVRSSLSVDSKASDTKASSICQINDTENSGTSLAVKIPKNDIDQSEERVENVVSLKSQASATSTESNSITKKNITKATAKSVTLGTANGKGLKHNEESAEERLKSKASFESNVSERSEMSRESDHCLSKSISTPTKTLQSDEQEVTSVESICRKTPTKCKTSSHLNINDDRVPSALSNGSARNKSSSGDLQLRCRDSAVSEHREKDFENEDTEKQDVSESGTVIKKGTAIVRDADEELTRTCDHESVHSVKKSSRKDTEMNKTSRTNSAAVSIVTWNCLSPSPSKGVSKKNKSPALQNGNSHDSNLSYSPSATDLLKYRSEDVRPDTAESKTKITEKTYNCVLEVTESYKNVNDNRNDKGGRCRRRRRSSSSLPKKEAEVLGIVPSCLPNTSPREVVHDWLKKIPTDSPIYDAGEEFDGQAYETNIQKNPTEKEEESAPKGSMTFDDEPVAAEEENKEENGGKEADDEDNKPFEESTRSRLPKVDEQAPSKCANREALQKSCQSSVQVMKVLLNPKLDRCNSLPEVSHVYGRKLSNSAKGLLDCLANLQLIDTDSADATARDARYNELMNVLQSLWLCDPLDNEKSVPFKNHRSADDPKSSSGVDVSSGSAGSGKGSDNGRIYMAQKTELPLSTGNALVDQNPLQPLEEEIEFTSSRLILDGEETVTLSDPATPDIAMRVRDSPVSEEEGSDSKRQEDKHKGPGSNETIRSDESPKEIIETPSTSNRSSGNEGNMLKLAGETVRDIKDVASSRTLPYSENIRDKKVSKDPDPVWVLNLLKKLEKQFMTHYVNAMAEFKVRWDLDDNVILDAMINELREEVSRRIQSSINRELQKIHSRAGREPRPPLQSISRESSAQTEQRRRRLKVMHNKSIKDSLQRSEENYTVTGTDFSDQRSEDGYCPCETCMKKKMASRLLEQKKNVCSAPVMMDFDLRKILQLKRQPPAILKERPNVEVRTVGGNGNQDTNENVKVLQGEGNREKAKLKELERDEIENEADEGVESISREQMTGNQLEKKEGGTAKDDAGKSGKDSEGIDVAEKGEGGQVYGETGGGDSELTNDGIAGENAAEDSEEDGVTIKEEDWANQDGITEENIASPEVAKGLADGDKGEADKYGSNEEYSRAVAETTEDYPGEGNRTHEDDDSRCVGTAEEHSADKIDNAEGQNPETSEDCDSVKEDGCDQLKESYEQTKTEVNTAIERQETEDIDVTVRVHVAETCSIEGNAEEQQHDGDIAEDVSETCCSKIHC
ncbi:retinitis pigmentosa 1-like 1 protein isoform X2 [Brienomyrus brachyistius]|uniref:retinitis pigmentosa 1-like 1 protein isoform X2 n=1 Tax=Brienomyrus brachyistius TaxID=42636 RepID=UPI0020B26534|nr:retinitis pigmentosa 1-like 1 protein isoform X2 [Brienomyrus brachyistius]